MKRKEIHYVYKLIKDDVIVYIGCSINVSQRAIAHKYTRPYDRIETMGPFKRAYAFQFETELIKIYRPKYNLSLNGKAGKKKVDPKEKVVLVGFYVKNRFIEEVGGMETARAIAKASLEDKHPEIIFGP